MEYTLKDPNLWSRRRQRAWKKLSPTEKLNWQLQQTLASISKITGQK